MFDPLLLSFPTGRRSAELKPLMTAFASAVESQKRRGNRQLYAAECGVWKGESLILCARVAQALGQRVTIFGLDTFSGLPELGPRDLQVAPSTAPYLKRQWFADTSLRAVQSAVEEAGFADAIRLVPGLFSETLGSLPDGPYCFVNVDCDLYQPHIECLEYFLPRMAPGGIIYFDDFHSTDFPMARAAIKQFLAAHKGLELVHLRFGEDEANKMKSLIVIPSDGAAPSTRSVVAQEPGADTHATTDESEPADVNFERIHWYLNHAKDRSFRLRPDHPDVIVMQMGKVASTAIYGALGRSGFNVFHCHGLSAHRQQQNLVDVLNAQMSTGLTGNRMRRHLFYLALHLMVRWYQTNQRRRGKKLKVISLTRDPVSRYISVLMQDLERRLPSILRWQCRRLRLEADAAIEFQQAIVDLVAELISIVTEHAPLDASACRAAVIRAKKKWPEDSIVVTQLRQLLLPLTWFDTEMVPVFEVDALANGVLRDQGWLEQHNDWAEVMVLRYEHLDALLPEMRRFFELPDLALDRENVMAEKAYAAEVRAAARLVFESAGGRAASQALRSSAYGKACGYDLLEARLGSPSPRSS